jgi:hypothetical protein
LIWNGGSVSGPVTRSRRITSVPSGTPSIRASRGSVSFSCRAEGVMWCFHTSCPDADGKL